MIEICKKEMSLFSFLEEKGFSHKKIKRLFQYQNVFVDGKLEKRDFMISPGMKVEIRPSYHTIDTMDILFEDKEIIVVNKRAGLLTISTSSEKEKTLYHMVSTYLKKKNKNNYLFVVHRLDRDTSGVVLFAKSRKIKDAFQKKWNDLAKERIYIALVHGHLDNKSGTITQYLRENKQGVVFTSNKEFGKFACTSYKVLKEYSHTTLLQISISTGRKNQIRIALTSIGHSIVGDKKYGSQDSFKRLCLHASKLNIIHPFTHRQMLFEAEVPKEFDKIGKTV